MPTRESRPGLLSRHALGLWFLGLAALGFMRFFMKVDRADGLPLPTDAWLWLAASIVTALFGVAAVVRERRRNASRP